MLLFGFFHGFGLATKLQEFAQAQQHIVPKIIAFNVGVELGQLLAQCDPDRHGLLAADASL